MCGRSFARNASLNSHQNKCKVFLKKSTEGLGATKRDAEKKAAEKALMELLDDRK